VLRPRSSKIFFDNASIEESKKRRNRFKWNPDFDELAKDASVIIKARCRSGHRMDWSAITQAFPVLAPNSVRQRMDGLIKDSLPTKAYLQRLEDAWYNLWMRHRGTPQLPDPNLKSMTDFDLIAHLTFLRAHIDKPSLCVLSSFSSFSMKCGPLTVDLQGNRER
jgi:transcription factor C subunit 3